jgi:hypothetical protein
MPREPKLAIDAALERRDKAELIALIRQMLARHPELEALLTMPLPTAVGRPKPTDPALIRHQALGAFQEAGHGWHAVSMAAANLEPLLQIGDDYVGLEDWPNAAVAYQTIAQTVLDQYGQLHDEEGDLHPVVDRCVEGLAECLRATEDPAQRAGLLRALFDIYGVAGLGVGSIKQVDSASCYNSPTISSQRSYQQCARSGLSRMPRLCRLVSHGRTRRPRTEPAPY